ncbi:CCA tRNA nucleotidyltransferase [Kytococcus schroeteri]|uniref:CCA tRNA nucleotidyltransferase n=1 Tax=Kytococcus schroeteri TaxID=138300 RepID=A0A2I1PCY6_9MICO|nr:CCA tRNA nucleotidyltransferase [Kytococcus schroeteri]PKZ42451.1 CCA tRNA nucleotidyltransferase [Kytococcus schroeteri]
MTDTPTSELFQRALQHLAPVMPLLSELGERFAAAGFELALVGGPVRDAFLGRTSPDLDLTTDARPDDIEAVLEGWADATWDLGRAFGTIGARKGEEMVEITTYRSDVYDRASRKPEVRFGESLTDDLVRRDFTVNAMALRLPQLEFVDPHSGLEALAAGELDTPTVPEESFADDPLRMMRACRFAAQLGLVPSARVMGAMQEMAASIEIVSAERVRDELTKLLLADRPRAGLEVFVHTGLAEQVLPELPALQLETDEHHRHKDVYEHSLIVLEQAIDLEGPREGAAEEVPHRDLVLRLAALLHDIGKPPTRRFLPGGRVSFHHHEVVGAKMARKRLRALRYDKDTIRDVVRLVELHLRFHGYGEGEWTDSAVRRYVTDAGPMLSRLHLLTRADCTTRNQRKAARLSRTYDELEERIDRIQAEEELAAVRPELNGHQIMQVLDIPPGPVLGEAYDHLLQYRLDAGPVGAEAAEAELRRWWAAREA